MSYRVPILAEVHAADHRRGLRVVTPPHPERAPLPRCAPTEYVWTCANIGRSFLFYDADGNMIQLWEHAGNPTWQT